MPSGTLGRLFSPTTFPDLCNWQNSSRRLISLLANPIIQITYPPTATDAQHRRVYDSPRCTSTSTNRPSVAGLVRRHEGPRATSGVLHICHQDIRAACTGSVSRVPSTKGHPAEFPRSFCCNVKSRGGVGYAHPGTRYETFWAGRYHT